VIRSQDTGFQADHFRATLRYGLALPDDRPPVSVSGLTRLPVDPATELYGPVLFQGARFQRLLGYRQLAATRCVADIGTTAHLPWFGGFLPPDLLLADPGARDAMMHSIQCCVPDATLLPAGIERLYLADPAAVRDLPGVVLHAEERSRDGDTYVYDLDVRDEAGHLVERWEGLTLRAVRKQDGSGPWTPVLLGPFLERRSDLLLPASMKASVLPDGEAPADVAGRRSQTAQALRRILGPDAVVRHRPDGLPETDGPYALSSSHGAGVTFAVAGAPGPLGCDVEPVTGRSEAEWSGLLGPDGLALARLVAAEYAEDLSVAATRVWGATEAARKAGRARPELSLAARRPDRWVVFHAGAARIATFPTTLRGVAEPVVFTMLSAAQE
jgi:enediyne polyketide synthase